MTKDLQTEILAKAMQLSKQYEFPANVWEAMRQCGIRDHDPARPEIFKQLSKLADEASKLDQKMATEIARMKYEDLLRDARAAEKRHPPDAYRN